MVKLFRRRDQNEQIPAELEQYYERDGWRKWVRRAVILLVVLAIIFGVFLLARAVYRNVTDDGVDNAGSSLEDRSKKSNNEDKNNKSQSGNENQSSQGSDSSKSPTVVPRTGDDPSDAPLPSTGDNPTDQPAPATLPSTGG